MHDPEGARWPLEGLCVREVLQPRGSPERYPGDARQPNNAGKFTFFEFWGCRGSNSNLVLTKNFLVRTC